MLHFPTKMGRECLFFNKIISVLTKFACMFVLVNSLPYQSLSLHFRCTDSSSRLGGTWNGPSSWKSESCVGFLKWCSAGSSESRSACLGTEQLSVLFQQQHVGWRALPRALWINLWQDLNWIGPKMGCLTLTCSRTAVIKRDREDWAWPTLGLF